MKFLRQYNTQNFEVFFTLYNTRFEKKFNLFLLITNEQNANVCYLIKWVGLFQDLSKNLLSLSKEIHLKHGGRLFFITAELKQIEALSPEHQDAINMLVEKIESTDIFQHVLRQVQLVSSCSQSSTGCSNHLVNGKSCKIGEWIAFKNNLTLKVFIWHIANSLI